MDLKTKLELIVAALQLIVSIVDLIQKTKKS